MKTRFALIASLCLLAGCSAQGPDNRTADLRGKRVLVFTGHGEGYVHENIAASAAMILELAAAGRLRSRHDIGQARLLRRLARTLRCDRLRERQLRRARLRAAVGLRALHPARRRIRRVARSDLHRRRLDLVHADDRRVASDFHPPLQRLTMKVVNRTHPSASMLPDTLTTEDELYCFKRLDPQARVLAVWETAGVDWGSGPKPEVMSPSLPGRLVQRVRRRPDLVHRRRTPPVRLCRYALPRAGARRAPAGSWPAKRAIQKRLSDGTALRNRRAGTRRPSDNPVGERPSACGPTAAESLPGGRDRRQGRRNKTGSLFPPSDREQEESGDTRSDRRPERSGRIAARQTP